MLLGVWTRESPRLGGSHRSESRKQGLPTPQLVSTRCVALVDPAGCPELAPLCRSNGHARTHQEVQNGPVTGPATSLGHTQVALLRLGIHPVPGPCPLRCPGSE